jgi:serine/threonine protein kinase
MGIAEMQRHFNAYGSGQLPEFELRRFICDALTADPKLSPAFIALTDAYRRANLIDAQLQSTINADIADLTGPAASDLTMVRTPGTRSGAPGWFADGRAANSTDVNLPTGLRTGPPMASPGRRGPSPTSHDRSSNTAPLSQGYGTSSEPSWRIDTPAPDPRAFNTGIPADGRTFNPTSTGDGRAFNTGSPATRTGSTGGSMWEVDGGLAEGTAQQLYPGSVIRDRFVLVEELGRGGMGVVYKAFDRSRGDVRDRYVAIKVLNEEFKRHPLAVRALQRESRKAQKLAHPNVVAVHDFDHDGSNVYMVMEFLSGRSLDQVLREDGQGGIPLEPAMGIIKCLAAALSYAHEQEIIHCDFKPSNAFLGTDGRVKVLDFGIARAAPSMQEKADVTKFDAGQLGAISPAYASLEMLQHEQPDVRDDVYAFSCVVYELLTGVHPYQRIDAMKAFQTGLQPRPIRKLSRRQWRALKQGLAFRRADRAPSIDFVATQLLSRPSRVNAWTLGAAACMGVVLLAGALWWEWPDLQRIASRAPWATHTHTPASAKQEVQPPLPSGSRPTSTVESVPATTVVDETKPPEISLDEGRRQLADLVSNPQPTREWAAAVQELITRLGVAAPPGDPGIHRARQSGVTTFVAAAEQARSRRQFDEAGNLLSIAGSFDADAPEIVSESAAIERDKFAPTGQDAQVAQAGQTAQAGQVGQLGQAAQVGQAAQLGGRVSEQKHTNMEMLKEQFETLAAAGDVAGATTTANMLSHSFAGSAYVSREMPRILSLAYVHLAKTQFAGGQVNAALQTLQDGRKKFGKSPDLKDLEARYVSAADLYDRLSTAVVLNVTATKLALDELRTSEGEEYEVAAQMLAQTLADRIADQRAANRQAVADKLAEAGKEVFPNYAGLLGRGRAGALQVTPNIVSDQ